MSLRSKKSSYSSKNPNKNGMIDYTSTENETWKILFNRQMKTIQNRACDEFFEGIKMLELPDDHIPQCIDISNALQRITGWIVIPVPALISPNDFFTLLSKKQFPAATFIRSREELDYLKEPDIFHEIYGHCPLLTNKAYADFVEAYGKLSLTVTPEEQHRLLRLFWLTIEFGLLRTEKGIRIYGGGILSSYEETIYALESPIPKRKHFTILDALRTPYRIDIKQPVYYIIQDIQSLYEIINKDLLSFVNEAIQLGDFKPEFKQINGNNK